MIAPEDNVGPEPLVAAEAAEDREESEPEDPKSSLSIDDQLNREPDPVDEDESPANRLKALLRRSTQLLDPREDRPAELGEEVAEVAAVAGVVAEVPDETAPIAAAA